MSIESILLLAFVLFPLLERLIRHLQGRAAQAPADPAAAPQPPGPTRRPPPGVPAEASTASGQSGRPAGAPAPVLVPPPLPARHPAVVRLSAGERVRAARMNQAEPVMPSSVARTRARARPRLSLHDGRADLRRAVVLMTVLGPCQALENEPGRR
jgi:hypothetical protein